MLDFLAKATISDVAEGAVRKSSGPRKERNPEGLAIRIFFDGSVFPSTELVSKFGLEYPMKDAAEAQPGNGFDVIDTLHYPTFQIGQRIIIISPVNRNKGKVDLFASTTYDENGAPKSDVLGQGAKTFGSEDLIPMLKEVYGLEFKQLIDYGEAGAPEGAPKYTEGLDSADLILVANPATGEPWQLPAAKNGVTYIPKRFSRGKDAGNYTTIRRENPEFYALIPKQVLEGTAAPAAPAPDAELTEA